MSGIRSVLVGLVLALGLGMASGGAATAQERELPTGAARVVEKVQFEAMVGKIQLESHVARILENNAGVIPGK